MWWWGVRYSPEFSVKEGMDGGKERLGEARGMDGSERFHGRDAVEGVREWNGGDEKEEKTRRRSEAREK